MSREPRPPSDDPQLERALEQAWDASAEPGRGRAASDAIGSAMGTFRRERRRRITLATTGCVVLLGLGLWIAAPWRQDEPVPVETADAVTYGRSLYQRVYGTSPDPSDDDVEVLTRDAAFRREVIAALDHESSYVRRVAIGLLGMGSVEVPRETMVRLLTEHREDLEFPIEVASVGDAGRLVASALERGRQATVQRVLSASFVLGAQGKDRLPPELVTPWLEHDNANIRGQALLALMMMDDYVPDESVWTMLREDPDLQVRQWALSLLRSKLGATADERLLAILDDLDDPGLEPVLLSSLLKVDGIEGVVRKRLQRGVTDLNARIAHVNLLRLRGDPAPARSLLKDTVATVTGPAAMSAASLMVALDAVASRRAFLARLPSLDDPTSSYVAGVILRWDAASGDRARTLESIALARDIGGAPVRYQLAQQKDHEDPAVRAAVQAALEALTSD